MADPTLTTLALSPDGDLIGPGVAKADNTQTSTSTLAASETVAFGRPRTPWTASTRAHFPSLGPGYHTFENEIMQAATADQAAIVTRWVNIYRQQHDAVLPSEIVAHRARLTAFVASYNASYP